jgi:hypothetical protein
MPTAEYTLPLVPFLGLLAHDIAAWNARAAVNIGGPLGHS